MRSLRVLLRSGALVLQPATRGDRSYLIHQQSPPSWPCCGLQINPMIVLRIG